MRGARRPANPEGGRHRLRIVQGSRARSESAHDRPSPAIDPAHEEEEIMSTIARRIRATPERSATEAWEVVVGLISEPGSAARKELDAASGIASCLVADETPKD